MDLNHVTGPRLREEFLVFVTFCTKEEGKPLETRTDDKCLFSLITDDFFGVIRGRAPMQENMVLEKFQRVLIKHCTFAIFSYFKIITRELVGDGITMIL